MTLESVIDVVIRCDKFYRILFHPVSWTRSKWSKTLQTCNIDWTHRESNDRLHFVWHIKCHVVTHQVLRHGYTAGSHGNSMVTDAKALVKSLRYYRAIRDAMGSSTPCLMLIDLSCNYVISYHVWHPIFVIRNLYVRGPFYWHGST